MKPYLIQRAKFVYDPYRNGIDSILSFDYMGGAEFEFGALPNSLNRIRAQISSYCLSLYSFASVDEQIEDKIINIFCKKSNHNGEVCKIIEGLASNKFRLKEYCDFSDWIHGKTNHRNNDFWWDIKNDYMFWKINPEFTDKFKKLIKENKKDDQ